MLVQFISIISLHETEIIIGVLATIAASALIFLFRNLFKKLWSLIFPSAERRTELDKKLKEHFTEIKMEAISLVNALNNLTLYKGAILTYPKNNQYNLRIDYPGGMSILPLSTVDFSSHFPKEASIFEGLRKGVEEHNKRLFALEDKSKDKDKHQKEVQYLVDSQNIIMVVGKENLSQEIMSKLDNVERFWPGTRSYRFKKMKSCPRCKEIFG